MLATWWRRAGGYLIDDVIILVPTLIVQTIVGAVLHQPVFLRGGFGAESGGDVIVRLLVNLALAFATLAYVAIFLRKFGGTIGMQAVGIEAIDRHAGTRLSVAQCWRRVGTLFVLVGLWGQIGFIIRAFYDNPNRAVVAASVCTAIGSAATLVTYLWAAGNVDTQTLQDKMAGSIVVLAEKDLPPLP